MSDLGVMHKDIEKIALINVSDELYSRIQIPSILGKMKECLDALDRSSSSIDELLDKGFFGRTWGALSGGTTRTLADAEKALVDSQRFNIGLTVLTSMLAKAIKSQQDEISRQQEHIASQQSDIRDSQRRIDEQHDEILRLTGVTKEQTHQIVQLLSGDDQLWQTIRRTESHLRELGQALAHWGEAHTGLEASVREQARALESVTHGAEGIQNQLAQVQDSQQVVKDAIARVQERFQDVSQGLAQAMQLKTEIRELQERCEDERKRGLRTRLLAVAAVVVGILNGAALLLLKAH